MMYISRLRSADLVAGAVLAVLLAACGTDAGVPPPSEPSVAGTDSGATAGPTTGSADSLPTSPDNAAGTPLDASLLTPDGWGPLRIGMSRAQVVAAAGEDANPDAVGGPDPERCDEFRPNRAPEGVLVMIEENVLTRISVSGNSEIATPEGLAVGDTGSRVMTTYGGEARVEPHAYWATPARYITVLRAPNSSAPSRGIRYEVDSNDRIVHIRAGAASIEYIEGCL